MRKNIYLLLFSYVFFVTFLYGCGGSDDKVDVSKIMMCKPERDDVIDKVVDATSDTLVDDFPSFVETLPDGEVKNISKHYIGKSKEPFPAVNSLRNFVNSFVKSSQRNISGVKKGLMNTISSDPLFMKTKNDFKNFQKKKEVGQLQKSIKDNMYKIHLAGNDTTGEAVKTLLHDITEKNDLVKNIRSNRFLRCKYDEVIDDISSGKFVTDKEAYSGEESISGYVSHTKREDNVDNILKYGKQYNEGIDVYPKRYSDNVKAYKDASLVQAKTVDVEVSKDSFKVNGAFRLDPSSGSCKDIVNKNYSQGGNLLFYDFNDEEEKDFNVLKLLKDCKSVNVKDIYSVKVEDENKKSSSNSEDEAFSSSSENECSSEIKCAEEKDDSSEIKVESKDKDSDAHVLALVCVCKPAVLNTEEEVVDNHDDSGGNLKYSLVYCRNANSNDLGLFANSNAARIRILSCGNNITDMSNMFAGCSSLTILDLSNFNTAKVTNMREMFKNCFSLTNLDFSNFNTSKVKDMSCMFYDCISLGSLNLSKFNTKNVTNMNRMFLNCTGLTSLDLSNFNTNKVKDMSEMFLNCTGLTSLNLSNFNTEQVTDMRNMFSKCSSLKELDLSNFNTSNVTNMSEMFSECSSLTSLNLSNFNTRSVDDVLCLNGMFYGCTSLSKLNLSLFDVSKFNDHNDNEYIKFMFVGVNNSGCEIICPSSLLLLLQEVYKDQVGDIVTEVKKVMSSCVGGNDSSQLCVVRCDTVVPGDGVYSCIFKKPQNEEKNVEEEKVNAEYIVLRKQQDENVNDNVNVNVIYDIKEYKEEVKKEGDIVLTKIGPAGKINGRNVVNEKYDSSVYYVQYDGFIHDVLVKYCRGNNNVILNDLDGNQLDAYMFLLVSVGNIEYLILCENANSKLFYGGFYDGLFEKSEATAIEILNCGSNITNMNRMFSSCESLVFVDLFGLSTNNVTDMRWMFYNCSSLTSLNLSNFNTAKVTNMSYMFYGCSSLTSLNLSEFNTAKVTNMNNMFNNCSSLTSLDLSNFNTSEVKYMINMFNVFSSQCKIICSSNLLNKLNTEGNVGLDFVAGVVPGRIVDWGVYECSVVGKAVNGVEVNFEGKIVLCKQQLLGGGNVICCNIKKYKGEEKNEGNKEQENIVLTRIGNDGKIDGCYVVGSHHRNRVYYVKYDKTRHGAFVRGLMGANEVILNGFGGQQLSAYMFSLVSVGNAKYLILCLDANSIEEKKNGNSYIYGLFKCSEVTVALCLSCGNNITNMGYMFSGCTKLTSLDLSNFVTNAVKNMRCMFSDCSSLTSLNLSNFNTENVEYMINMFSGCSSLTSLNLSNWNTSKVKNMNSMFYNCNSLTSLNLSSFKTDKVIYMSYMFDNCSSLTSLDLSNFDTSKVIDMYAMFRGCSSLKLLNLSKFVIKVGSNINFMFNSISKQLNIIFSPSLFRKLNVVQNSGINIQKEEEKKEEDKKKEEEEKKVEEGKEEEKKEEEKKEEKKKAEDIDDDKIYKCFVDNGEIARDKILEYNNAEEELVNEEVKEGVKCVVLRKQQGEDVNGEVTYDIKGYKEEEKKDGDIVLTLIGADGKIGDCNVVHKKYSGSVYYAKYDGSIHDVLVNKCLLGYNNIILRDLVNKNQFGTYVFSFVYVGGVWYLILCFDANGIDEKVNHVSKFYGLFKWSNAARIRILSCGDKVTNMSYMFADCTGLTSLDLSSFNTEQVTDMREMFNNCSSLTSLDLSNFNTANVTNMRAMFANCSSLKELDLSSFKTEQVTNMGCMFYNCSSLTSLDLKNFNTNKVTDMRYMFSGCSSLKKLDISSFDTENVESMSYMFANCSSLKSLNLSKFVIKVGSDIINMFNSISKQLNIIFSPSLFRKLNVVQNSGINIQKEEEKKEEEKKKEDIDNGKIYRCFVNNGKIEDILEEEKKEGVKAGVESIVLRKQQFIGSNGEVIYDIKEGKEYIMKEGDIVLTLIGADGKIDGRYVVGSHHSNRVYYVKYDVNLHNVFVNNYFFGRSRIILNGFDGRRLDAYMLSLVSVGSEIYLILCFDANSIVVKDDCFGLFNYSQATKIEILSCGSNIINMMNMFADCIGLTSLDLSKFNTSNVINMSHMFSWCIGLTSLDLSNFNTSNVINMSHMFSECSSLKSLDLSNFKTAKVTNMNCMFNACFSLANLDLSNFNTNKVTDMYAMFRGCSSLTSLNLSNFNTSEDTDVGKMFYGVFSRCDIICSSNLLIKLRDQKDVDAGEECVDFSKIGDDVCNLKCKCFVFNNMASVMRCIVLCSENNDGIVYRTEVSKLEEEEKKEDHKKEEKNEEQENIVLTQVCPDGKINGVKIVGEKHSNRVYYVKYDLHYDAFVKDLCKKDTITLKNLSGEDISAFMFSLVYVNGIAYLILCLDANSIVEGNGCFGLFEKSAPEAIKVLICGDNIKDMSCMFSNCSSLTSLNLSKFKTNKVTKVCAMFYKCSSLTSLDLSNFKTTNVIDMRYMFYNCGSLTSLDLKNFNTDKVTDMSWMFSGCSSLTILDLSNFDTSNVTSMYGMFSLCSSLKFLNLSNFDTNKVKDMGGMFLNLSSGCDIICSSNLLNKLKKTLNVGKDFGRVSNIVKIEDGKRYKCSVANESVSVAVFEEKEDDGKLNVVVEDVDSNNVNLYIKCREKMTTKLVKVSASDDVVGGIVSDHFAENLYFCEYAGGCRNLIEYLSGNCSEYSVYRKKRGIADEYPATKSILAVVTFTTGNDGGVLRQYLIFYDGDKYNHVVGGELYGLFHGSGFDEIEFLYCGEVGISLSIESMFSGCNKLRKVVFGDLVIRGGDMMVRSSLALISEISNIKGVRISMPICLLRQYMVLNHSTIENGVRFGKEINRYDSGGNTENFCKLTISDVALSEDKIEEMNNINPNYRCNVSFENGKIVGFDIDNYYILEHCNVKSVNKKVLKFVNSDGMRKVYYNSMELRFIKPYEAENVVDKSVVEDKKEEVEGNKDEVKEEYVMEFKQADLAGIVNNEYIKSVDGRVYRRDYKKEDYEMLTENYFNNVTYHMSPWENDTEDYNSLQYMTNSYIIALVTFVGKGKKEEKCFVYCRDANSIKKGDEVFGLFQDSKATKIKILRCGDIINAMNMFSGCGDLIELDLKNLKTHKVIDMGYMFYNCSKLTKLDVSNFKTTNVTNMRYMFYNCNGLLELDLSSFNTSNVTDMRYMFAKCSRLRELRLSRFITSKVTNMSGMFNSCVSLVLLDISNFHFIESSNKKDIFYQCFKRNDNNDVVILCNYTIRLVFELYKNLNPPFQIFSNILAKDDVTKQDNLTKIYNMKEGYVYKITFKKANVAPLGNVQNNNINDNNIQMGGFGNIVDNDIAPQGVNDIIPYPGNKVVGGGNNVHGNNVSELDVNDNITLRIDTISFHRDDDTRLSLALKEKIITTLLLQTVFCLDRLEYMYNNLYSEEYLYLLPQIIQLVDNDDMSNYSYDDYVAVLIYLLNKPFGRVLDQENMSLVDIMNNKYRENNSYGELSGNNRSYDESYLENDGEWCDVYGRRFINLNNIKGAEFVNIVKRNVGDGGKPIHEIYISLVKDEKDDNCRYFIDNVKKSNQQSDKEILAYVERTFEKKIDEDRSECIIVKCFIYCPEASSIEYEGKFYGLFKDSEATKIEILSCGYNLRNIFYMFANCSQLAKLDLSEMVLCPVNSFDYCINCGNILLGTFQRDDPDEVFVGEMRINAGLLKTFIDNQIVLYPADKNSIVIDIICNSKNRFRVYRYDVKYSYDIDKLFVYDKNKTDDKNKEEDEEVEDDDNLSGWDNKIIKKDEKDKNTKGGYINVNLDGQLYDKDTGQGYIIIRDSDNECNDNIIIEYGIVEDDNLMSSVELSSVSNKYYNTDSIHQRVNKAKLPKGLMCSLELSASTYYVELDGKLNEFVAFLKKHSQCKVRCSIAKLEQYDEENNENKRMDGKFERDDLQTYVFAVVKCGNVQYLICYIDDNSTTKVKAGLFQDIEATEIEILSCGNEVTDMSNMFRNCSSLTSLNLSNFKTDNVANMGYMFYNCSSLTSLNLSNFNTDNVTDMSYMFANCSSLTSIDLSKLNTANVTNMRAMFYNCSSLPILDLSNFNIKNAKYMSNMFANCSSLTRLNLSNFNTKNVTDMSGMFYKCSSLKSLNLSNFNTSKVTDMSCMFANCSSLTTLNLSNFVTKNVINMNEMFSFCSSLTSLDLSNFKTNKVINMRNMFFGCSSLTSLDLSNFNTVNVTDMNFMFKDCSSLTSLDLSSFDTKNVTYMINMFSGCSSLTSLNLSNFNTNKVKDMGGMFQDCTGLTSLDLSNFNTENVTNMYGMFSNCKSLTELDLSKFSFKECKITSDMFNNCVKLRSLNISQFDIAGNEIKIVNISCMFAGCSSLVNLNIACFTNVLLEASIFVEKVFKGCFKNGANITITCRVGLMRKLILYTRDNSASQSFGVKFTCTNMSLKHPDILFTDYDELNNVEFDAVYSFTFKKGDKDDSSMLFYRDCKPYSRGNNSIHFDRQTGELIITFLENDTASNKKKIHFQFQECTHEIIKSQQPTEHTKDIYKIKTNGIMYNWDSLLKCINNMKDFVVTVNDKDNYKIHLLALIKIRNTYYLYVIRGMNGAPVDLDSLSGLFSLQEIVILFCSSDVTSFKNMFFERKFLSSVKILNVDLNKITNMENMFFACEKLKNVEFINTTIPNVVTMQGMFSNCESLEKVDLSSFSTKKVISMQNMFSGCTSLKELDLSNFDTGNVKDMSFMFCNCIKLEKVDLSNFNMGNVVNMSYMFCSCVKLCTIIFSRYTMWCEAKVDGMFENAFQQNINKTLFVTAYFLKKIWQKVVFGRNNISGVVPQGNNSLYCKVVLGLNNEVLTLESSDSTCDLNDLHLQNYFSKRFCNYNQDVVGKEYSNIITKRTLYGSGVNKYIYNGDNNIIDNTKVEIHNYFYPYLHLILLFNNYNIVYDHIFSTVCPQGNNWMQQSAAEVDDYNAKLREIFV